eukprot:9491555-Pyramimonas_sp.AAC.1
MVAAGILGVVGGDGGSKQMISPLGTALVATAPPPSLPVLDPTPLSVPLAAASGCFIGSALDTFGYMILMPSPPGT